MRHRTIPVVLIIAISAIGWASTQTQSDASKQQQPAQQQNPLPGSPEHQQQIDKALNSESGRAGKQEPLPNTPTDSAALVNGAWNVPGAPKDGQTIPAKFSKRNDMIDKLPIMASALWLNDDQRRKIVMSLRAASAPATDVDLKVTQELLNGVEMSELPASLKADILDLQKLKYVRTQDRILLIDPPNRIVVGEISTRE